ncbi:hypothetical protein [Calothrix sp. PCC 6303]|uniref:hypothetical protein n=1 Tax=Calothrix sp. PCC 6303 TaxID=1170562 RepID=UPI0002A00AF1|nr:hypothetical protein [Calothrix sp. PCC 6303]AFZ01827.1 hypothetical protein Cal6303_2872 [Calothrix sp. PCC 6303]
MVNNKMIEEEFSHKLVEAGLISEEQLREAIKQNQISGKHLEEIFIDRGWIKPETIIYLKNNSIYSELQNQDAKLQANSTNNLLHFNFSPKLVFGIMLKIISFFVVTHLITQIIKKITPDFFLRDGISNLFYLDSELTFPAVYSALALLFAAMILGTIAYLKKRMNDSYIYYWQWLGVIFLFLSFDELVSLHEKMMNPVKALHKTSGFLYFAWVIPGSIGVLIFLLIFLKFIINLPHKTRNHFLIAGCIYLSGCIGCELIGGYIVDNQGSFTSYLAIMTLEESLEMLGIAVFIYGLLSHISNYTKGAILQIQIPAKKNNLSNSQLKSESF